MTQAPRLSAESLLKQAARGGVFRTDPEFARCAFHAAASLRLDAYRLELGGVRDTTMLFHRLAQSLHFPDWFGHNWDALADCLSDLSWRDADGYVIVLCGLDDMQKNAPDLLQQLLAVLQESASFWRAQNLPFWVLAPANISLEELKR